MRTSYSFLKELLSGWTICAIMILNISPSKAEDFKLAFPVGCHLGKTCFIASYMDMDDRVGHYNDYYCGSLVDSDNQHGTRIALKNFLNTKLNVPVYAAEDGRVVSIAGGLDDLIIDPNRISKFQGNPCGNGIVIEHKGGWFTRYCHLKNDSIAVTLNQEVKKGEIIAAVGSSGKTEWPRLDFTVSRNNYVFDPFSGKTTLERCGQSIASSLWDEDYSYMPFDVLNHGFMVGWPSVQAAELGTLPDFEYIPDFAAQMSFWAFLLNMRQGDRIMMELRDPNGVTLNKIDFELEYNSQRELIYLGTPNQTTFWLEGGHIGTITIQRYVNGKLYEVTEENTVTIYADENNLPSD